MHLLSNLLRSGRANGSHCANSYSGVVISIGPETSITSLSQPPIPNSGRVQLFIAQLLVSRWPSCELKAIPSDQSRHLGIPDGTNQSTPLSTAAAGIN